MRYHQTIDRYAVVIAWDVQGLPGLRDRPGRFAGRQRDRSLVPNRPTTATLQHKTFASIKYVIEGLVPDGLSMLVGRPKIGASAQTVGFQTIAVHRCGRGEAIAQSGQSLRPSRPVRFRDLSVGGTGALQLDLEFRPARPI
jgi:hypothetical protein